MTNRPAPSFRTGDVVHVRATVLVADPDGDGDVRVSLRYTGGRADISSFVSASEIVHVEPQPLAVGDRVRAADGTTLTILAIHDTYAWTVRDGRPPLAFSLSQLERLP